MDGAQWQELMAVLAFVPADFVVLSHVIHALPHRGTLFMFAHRSIVGFGLGQLASV
jgi:hypothetical protein